MHVFINCFPCNPAVQSQGLRSASLLALNNQRKELSTCSSKGLFSSYFSCLMFLSFPVPAWTLCHTIQFFVANVFILARMFAVGVPHGACPFIFHAYLCAIGSCRDLCFELCVGGFVCNILITGKFSIFTCA